MANFSNKQRLQSIYNAIDRDDYDQAIKICSRNDMADCIEAKALMAFAFAKLNMFSDAMTTALTVKSLQSVDSDVLQNISTVFRQLGCFGDIAECYENALVLCPSNVHLGTELFHSTVKLFNPAKQQQIALKIYRQFTLPHFLYWAATSAIQRAKSLCDSTQASLCLQVSERFLLKLMSESVEEPSSQEMELLVECLFMQKKFQECRQHLDAFVLQRRAISSQNQLKDEESFKTSKLIKMTDQRLAEVEVSILQELGQHEACLHKLFDVIDRLDDSYVKWKLLIDCWIKLGGVISKEELSNFISMQQSKGPGNRNPALANMYWIKQQLLFSYSDDLVSELTTFVLNYLLSPSFGERICAFDDTREYIIMVKQSSPACLFRLLSETNDKLSVLAVDDENESHLCQWLVLNQIQFLLTYCPDCHLHIIRDGIAHDCQAVDDDDDVEWLNWTKGKLDDLWCMFNTISHARPKTEKIPTKQGKPSKGRNKKKQQQVVQSNESDFSQSKTQTRIEDDLVSLMFEYYHDIVHYMTRHACPIDAVTDVMIECASRLMECLNGGHVDPNTTSLDLHDWRYNYTIKIQLINCLHALNCHEFISPIFSSLRVRHAQTESLSYIIMPIYLTSGQFKEALSHCQSIISFHRSCDRDNGFGISNSIQEGNYAKAIEIYEFQEQMERSLVLACSRVTASFLNLLLTKHSLLESDQYLSEVCLGHSSTSLIHSTITASVGAHEPILFKIDQDGKFDQLLDFCDYGLFQSFTTKNHADILIGHQARNLQELKFRHYSIVSLKLLLENNFDRLQQVVDQLKIILDQRVSPVTEKCPLFSTNFVDHVSFSACYEVDLAIVQFLTFSFQVANGATDEVVLAQVKQFLSTTSVLFRTISSPDIELMSHLMTYFLPIACICLQHLDVKFKQNVAEVVALVVDLLDSMKTCLSASRETVVGDVPSTDDLSITRDLIISGISSSRRATIDQILEIIEQKKNAVAFLLV